MRAAHQSVAAPILCGLSKRSHRVTAELATIIDFIRYGASRFGAAGLTFGHSYDNPLDEATHLVLHACTCRTICRRPTARRD